MPDDTRMIPAADKVSTFLSDLTDLGRKHKLALDGSMTLFEMHPDDLNVEYVADGDDTVTFGKR